MDAERSATHITVPDRIRQTSLPPEVISEAHSSIQRLSRVVQTAQTKNTAAFDAFERALTTLLDCWQARPELELSVWADTASDILEDSDDAVAEKDLASRSLAAACAAPLTIPGLRRLKTLRGNEAVLALFSAGPRQVRLSKREVQQRLYASQEFFDPDKGARALLDSDGEALPPASIRIRASDSYLHFVLADGHHRVLAKYVDGEPVTLLVGIDETMKLRTSFRDFAEEHGRQLR